MNKQHKEKKEELKTTTRQSIVEKYGGAEHFETPPKELLLAQTERYVEYSRTGQVIKGQELRLAKSKYEEDSKEPSATPFVPCFSKSISLSKNSFPK